MNLGREGTPDIIILVPSPTGSLIMEIIMGRRGLCSMEGVLFLILVCHLMREMFNIDEMIFAMDKRVAKSDAHL